MLPCAGGGLDDSGRNCTRPAHVLACKQRHYEMSQMTPPFARLPDVWNVLTSFWQWTS